MLPGYACSFSLLRQSLSVLVLLMRRVLYVKFIYSYGYLGGSVVVGNSVWNRNQETSYPCGVGACLAVWLWGEHWNPLELIVLLCKLWGETSSSQSSRMLISHWDTISFLYFAGRIKQGLLQRAFICLALSLYHCCMMLFTERWHPFLTIVLTSGGALSSNLPTNCKFYFTHLLILRSQDHFCKKPM